MSISTPYLRKSGTGTYYVHWTENRIGKRVSTRQKTLAEAQKFLGTWLLMDRAAPAPAGVTLTIAELWPVYFGKQLKAGPSEAAGEFAWKNLQPFFGSKIVTEVSQMVIDSYVQRRTSGQLGRLAKPQTCRRELQYLMACLRFCAHPKQKLFAPALIEAVELPEPGEARDRWLKTAEIQKLLNAAADMRRGDRLSRGERFLWLALETAGRKQALLDLTWDRVDFETRVIHLDVPGRKKTSKGRANVPISKSLLPVLERAAREATGDLVLDNKGAMWATIQHIATRAGLAGRRDKVPAGKKPKATGISPHVLRHTAATHMARRGVPLWIIAKILGNSLLIVERVYAKFAPDDLRAAVDMISMGELEPAE
jgi:integrase